MLASYGVAGPQYIGVATNFTTATATTIAVNNPTGSVTGDLLIALLSVDSATTPTFTGTGWTFLVNSGSTNNAMAVAYRTSNGSASYSFGYSTARRLNATIIAYRPATYDVSNGATITSGTTGLSVPSLTLTGNPEIVLMCAVAQTSTTNTVTSIPAGFTNLSWLAGNSNGQGIWAKTYNATGATGTFSVAASATTRFYALGIK